MSGRNFKRLFWDHSKQHSSKTALEQLIKDAQFWDHSKQHSSKTQMALDFKNDGFWDHSKQHSSKTHSYIKRVTV